jgi:signal recognition particle subunit SRP54
MMGAPDVPKELVEQGGEKLNRYRIIISSMTKAERNDEKLLHQPGRVARIAKGSGTTEKDVHALVSDFNKMKKMFGMFKNDRGMKKRFKGLV